MSISIGSICLVVSVVLLLLIGVDLINDRLELVYHVALALIPAGIVLSSWSVPIAFIKKG